MNRREFVQSVAAVAAGLPGVARAAVDPAPPEGDAGRALPKRRLGKTGVEVSVLALGGVIGMQRPPEDGFDPSAIAEAALGLGVNYFDTAPAYNKGQSETNYGPVVTRRRGDIFLATKTGDRTYDGTMRSVEQSLKRLRTDHVDLLQIHGVRSGEDPAAWGRPDGVLAAMRKLRDEKVTRFIGLTGHEDAGALRRAIEMHQFDTILTTFNPTEHRRPWREQLLPMANRQGLGVIAMKVMGGGNGCLVVGNPLKQRLQPYHDETDHQVEAAALLRYALGLPIAVAAVGVASIEQLRANVAAACRAPLSPEERVALERRMA